MNVLRRIHPNAIMAPENSAYVHGALIIAGADVLHVSGQIGADAEGSVPSDPVQRAENA